jgi:hypothetical protein
MDRSTRPPSPIRLALALGAALLLPALAPTTLRAQIPTREEAEEQVLPEPGTWGIGFAIPQGGGSEVVLRHMSSPSRSFGLGVQFGLRRRESVRPDGTQTRTDWAVAVHPDFRFYQGSSGPVESFIQLDAGVGYSGQSSGDAWSVQGDVGVGIGAEWFPVSHVSIAGSTGVAAHYRHIEGPQEATDKLLDLASAQSQLILTLYF